MIVMLPGGTGVVDPEHDPSFTVRTRALWLARGDAILVQGAVADERGARSTPAFARRVAALVATARARAPGLPVFLLGTSQGTIAAVNGAAHAAPGSLAGVILTESVTVPGRLSTETVFDADPAAVRVPVLVVANRADRCPVASPAATPRIAAALTASPRVDTLTVEGGEILSRDPCASRTPHGYWGLDARMVALIGQWIDARSPSLQSPGTRSPSR